ncbi:MAG TPA: 50S ribosomal protein L13 [Candidatus Acidoferrales bacterium]|nr:50S ribosomal protein L13 [Candidatus Acidoferrales bacterium]
MTGLMRTHVPKGREAEDLQTGKNWFVVNAEGVVLGRLATRIARLLIGKDKANYTPHLDCGDHVVVINAERVKLTGNKIDQKIYRHHSGFPGGLKEIPIRVMLQRRPEEVVREAVLGMLPKNKLRARRAKKLRVYAGSESLARHTGQKPQPLAL